MNKPELRRLCKAWGLELNDEPARPTCRKLGELLGANLSDTVGYLSAECAAAFYWAPCIRQLPTPTDKMLTSYIRGGGPAIFSRIKDLQARMATSAPVTDSITTTIKDKRPVPVSSILASTGLALAGSSGLATPARGSGTLRGSSPSRTKRRPRKTR